MVPLAEHTDRADGYGAGRRRNVGCCLGCRWVLPRHDGHTPKEEHVVLTKNLAILREANANIGIAVAVIYYEHVLSPSIWRAR